MTRQGAERNGETSFLRIASDADCANRVATRESAARIAWIIAILGTLLSIGGLTASLEEPMSNRTINIGLAALALMPMRAAFSASTYQTAVMTSQPAAYWRFEETTGDASSALSGGASGSLSGTIVRGVPSAAPSLGSCYQFSNGAITVPFSVSTQPNLEWSVELWAQVTTLTSPAHLIGNGRDLDPGSSSFVIYGPDPSTGTFWIGGNINRTGGSGGPAANAGAKLQPADISRWHHYVFVHSLSAGMARFYVDGVLATAAPLPSAAFVYNNAPFYIGKHWLNPPYDYPFYGMIDELAIYQRALPESEIIAHHCASGVAVNTCCPGDLNGDGQVDGADISAVLSFWGPNPVFPAADINGDGVVNGADLAAVLSSWGPCSH